ncbi:2-polyprenyl-6-methoxyphenol hydroxylase [Collimonas sp. OK307]|uniref:FAD binding domain-containing protein n=1 Tax=Collimonas sp. OK307 TaxID=1801620 RepID=UPI0008F0288E|nr:FAD binding domain-containing protein [Collimonas sp. OK307]SFH61959.1 2-polyprenyl-6-methoxyphenol hydroxylase [Collimonas sp. OK307]
MTKYLDKPIKLDTPKAVVIGGSLGGLFAAAALRAIGWDVEIFERSAAALDSRGGGIVLQGEVQQAMEFAKISTVLPLGVRSRERLYYDRLGNILSQNHMPQTQTSWNTLYNTLIAGFPEKNYRRGAELIGIHQDEHGVVATFADGSSAQADLLIGADGGGSTVRSLVLPNSGPSYAGYVAWRGLVDEGRFPEFATTSIYENFVFQHDPESMMLEYMVPGFDGSVEPGKRRYNWLWYLKASAGAELEAVLTDRNGKRRSHSIPPGMLAPEQESWIRRMGEERLNPIFRELMQSTDEIFVQAIQDLQVPKMVFGRVLLVGDAASIPRPHTAGSTAKAAASAITLARQLSNYADLGQALLHWEAQQLSEAARVGQWGVNMGNRIMGITNNFSREN